MIMRFICALVGVPLIGMVLLDAFEAVVLPRRVTRPYRFARIYYRAAWNVWRWTARQLPPGRWRNGLFGVFGPASLFGLMLLWAAGFIYGFALLHWSLGLAIAPRREDFATYLYFSGATFFTLGYGDMVPHEVGGRVGHLSSVPSNSAFVRRQQSEEHTQHGFQPLVAGVGFAGLPILDGPPVDTETFGKLALR